MMKLFPRLGLLLLVNVYLLAVQHVASTAMYPDLQAEQHSADRYGNSGTVGLVAQHTSPAESLVNSPAAPAASSFKKTSSEFVTCVRVKALAVYAAFAVQVRASRDIVLALRRAEILFPFHSFW